MSEEKEEDDESPMPNEEELTATQARKLLDIGPTQFARLLKEKVLPFRTSPLDRRVHLVKRRDVVTLLQAAQGMTVEQARKALGKSSHKILALIASGDLEVKAHPLNTKQRLVIPESFARLLAERNADLKRELYEPENPPS